MMKNKKQKNENKPFEKQKNTVFLGRNQAEVPFLYIAMNEPKTEYKKIPDKKEKLYRIVKIKN